MVIVFVGLLVCMLACFDVVCSFVGLVWLCGVLIVSLVLLFLVYLIWWVLGAWFWWAVTCCGWFDFILGVICYALSLVGVGWDFGVY